MKTAVGITCGSSPEKPIGIQVSNGIYCFTYNFANLGMHTPSPAHGEVFMYNDEYKPLFLEEKEAFDIFEKFIDKVAEKLIKKRAEIKKRAKDGDHEADFQSKM